MKNLLFVACTIFLCYGCGSEKDLDMVGVYKIISNSVKSDTQDTTYTNRDQLKIYTEDFMMYANMNETDSVSAFGIGPYSMTKDTLIENVIYSARDTMIYDAESTFFLTIQKTADGYIQTIPEMTTGSGAKYTLTENYERIGLASEVSSLDGAWQMEMKMDITGTDTVRTVMTQYKTYFRGYFIWGHVYKDSSGKNVTGVGYGSFTMTGADKAKESVEASFYADAKGQEFNLDIEMNGSDEFTQTWTGDDRTKHIEQYKRLKK